MSTSHSIVKQWLAGSLVSVLISILIGILNYLTRRTLALSLSEAAYGFFYSAFSFVMLFLAYLDLGLNSSGTILIARHDAHGRHAQAQSVFSIVLLLKLGGGLAVAIVLIALAPFLVAGYFNYPDGFWGLVVLCAFIPANALCGTIVSTLDAYRDFLARNLFQTAKFGLIFLGVVIFAPRLPHVGPALAFAIGATLSFAVGLVYLKRKKGLAVQRPGRDNVAETWAETWHFGKWVAISTAGMTTMFYMDTLMLTPMKGLESVALYNVALPVMQIMQSVMVLPLIFMPVATQLWQHGYREELAELINLVLETCIVFLCLVTVVMAGLREIVIRLLFAERFIPAGTALVILCAAMAVLVLGHFLINTLNAMERPGEVARMVVAGAIVNVLANAILIPRWGIEGAALATLLSYAVIASFGYRAIRRALTLSFRPLTVLPVLATTAVSLILIVRFRWQTSDGQALLSCALACLAILATLAVFNRGLLRNMIAYAKRRS